MRVASANTAGADERVHQILSTGAVAALLQVVEPRPAEFVRRGKIAPAPRVVAGRRQWEADHVLQAARLLGRDEVAVLAQLLADTGETSGGGGA